MKTDFLSQAPYRCRFDWGTIGAERAAARNDCTVLVDTLSFSTSVVYAVSKGAIIYPCGKDDDYEFLAQHYKAEVAVARKEVPRCGRFSLSPSTFDAVTPNERILLPSLNGSACSVCASGSHSLVLGAIVNASAAARYVNDLLETAGCGVTVVACGEREKESGDLRVAIEDLLATGAIISMVNGSKSPEAVVCEAAFLFSRNDLKNLILDSVSGRELIAEGFAGDVEFAVQFDQLDTVPILRDQAFVSNSD